MRSGVNIKTSRRDWFRIIRDLMGAGVSMGAIARKCNRDVCTVKGWADGGEPKESDARIILALYAMHCPVKYVEHQREYRISVLMNEVVSVGESYGLPFVDDRDE